VLRGKRGSFLEYKKINLIHILSVAMFIKILITGLSYSDSLGALVLLSALQLDRVLSHLYPKQVDVFKELSLIQNQLVEVISKNEVLERDVTALKIGGMKR
jgi:hypothetical protein